MSDYQTGEAATPVILSPGRHAPDDPPPLGPSSTLETVESETRHYRHDGWTPAARASFLEMLAKSGVVTDACREVGRSSQAAYALRNRDPLFAAGWETALSMARARLADELFHRAVHGTVEQIWKDGEVIAERHRHDNRLSMAVLNRLDARSDRAERFAAPSQRLAANWEAYLEALAKDRVADLEAMVAPPPAERTEEDDAMVGDGDDSMLMRQLHQLREGAALHESEDFSPEDDDEQVWIEDHSWRTRYPPPDGFQGYEEGVYGDDDYSRQCTPEERELLDRRYPDAIKDWEGDRRKAHEAQRDAFFAGLADQLDMACEDEHADRPFPSFSQGDAEKESTLSSLSQGDGEGDRPRECGDGGGAEDG